MIRKCLIRSFSTSWRLCANAQINGESTQFAAVPPSRYVRGTEIAEVVTLGASYKGTQGPRLFSLAARLGRNSLLPPIWEISLTST